MGEIRVIAPSERPAVDRARIDELYGQLGFGGAEEVVCRAMEELAIRMSHVERLYVAGQREEMRKNVRALIGISEQIGLSAMARIAGDVMACIDDCDRIALASTFARLTRVCEGSLVQLWDTQDMMI